MAVGAKNLSALVQVEKEVTRKGTTYTQHFWVKQEEAERKGYRRVRDKKEFLRPPKLGLPNLSRLVDKHEFKDEVDPISGRTIGWHVAALEANKEAIARASDFLNDATTRMGGGVNNVFIHAERSAIYYAGDHAIGLSETTAKQALMAIQMGEPPNYTSHEGTEILVHEMFHSASGHSARGQNLYEPPEEPLRPFAAIEEGTTEILAQHYLPEVAGSLGVKIDPEYSTEKSPLFSRDETTGDIITWRPTAYNTFVTQYARAAVYSQQDKLEKTGWNKHDINDVVVSSALNTYGVTDQDRYWVLASPMVEQHGMEYDHPKRHETVSAIAEDLKVWMAGDHSTGELDATVAYHVGRAQGVPFEGESPMAEYRRTHFIGGAGMQAAAHPGST